jgi:hypothetical protein
VTPRLSTQLIPLIHGAGHGFAQDVIAPPRPRTHLRNARFVLATGRPIAPP